MQMKTKRFFDILVSFALVLGLMSAFALAAEAATAVPYIERRWDGSKVKEETKYCTNYTVINKNTKLLNGYLNSWYVVAGHVSINDSKSRMIVLGTVNLILGDGAKLYNEDGICVPQGSTLNIYSQKNGTGVLYCDADDNDNAAIGANNEAGDCGNINIHGGIVVADTAKMGTDAAGIGGGDEGNGGNVTIYGGSVLAKGGKYGAGIGGGDNDKGRGGNGGVTTIYGGQVRAYGGRHAAGIGGGEGEDLDASGDTIISGGTTRIYGGEVWAYGGTDGAGIGGGKYGSPTLVQIYGGKVVAVGCDCGAGIGGGTCGGAGYVEIKGGNVYAQGDPTGGAGIGTGLGKVIKGGKVYILGGTVTAIGYEGIGAYHMNDLDKLILGRGIILYGGKSTTSKMQVICGGPRHVQKRERRPCMVTKPRN